MKQFKIGQIVSHKAYPDFRGKVTGFKNGKSVNVKVLAGWKGKIPAWPVPIQAELLEGAE